MGTLLITRTALVVVALGTAASAVADGDRHQLHLGVAASYAATDTVFDAWPEGGLGKLRDADDGMTALRVFAEYRGRITPTLHARVVADYLDDGSSGLDLTEAYLDWRPIPRSRNQQQWRFGAFYPALSLENGARGWESPFTYSYSAINTWLGEEIRPIGAEWSLRRRLERFGNAQEVKVFAAGFYGNDPAGTLLFWRGWSLHDRQSRLNDRLPVPPAPVRDANGNVIGLVAQPLEPFTEVDHRPGAYAGLEWRYARRALVQLARYDNRADPDRFRDGMWGWRTEFDHLAVQVSLPAEVGLVAQWMRGTTGWIGGALPDGTLNPTARFVVDRFDSQFVLLTRKLRDRHRLTARYDDFETVRPADPRMPATDAGRAWTLSYRYAASERFSGGVEWLEIHSRRGLWPFFYASPPQAVDEQLRLQFAFELGAPTGRRASLDLAYDRRMRIVHVEAGRHLYGGAAQVHQLIDGLAAADCANVLVCARGSALAARPPACDVVALPMGGELDVLALPRLVRLLKSTAADLVHVHSRRGADFYGGLAARLVGVPAVLTRRVDRREPRWLGRLKYRRYAAVIALSRAIEAQLLAAGADPARVTRIPSAVDVGRYRPDATARARVVSAYGLPTDALLIGVVAQLIARKRHSWLFAELPALVRRWPQVRVLCFGRGPLERALRAELAARGLTPFVTLAGFRDDWPLLLPGLDLVVHPAEREGLGLALLEAAAAGVPVAACAAGGVPDIVDHGRTGLLAPVGDAGALRVAIERLLAAPEERQRFGTAARAWAEQRFAPAALITAHLALYRRVLAERVGRPAAILS